MVVKPDLAQAALSACKASMVQILSNRLMLGVKLRSRRRGTWLLSLLQLRQYGSHLHMEARELYRRTAG